MIKAVCFDVAGVMTHPIGPVFATCTYAAGLDLQDLVGSALSAFSSPGDGDVAAHRLEQGQISLREFLDGLDPSDRATRVLMDPASRHFAPAAFEPHEGMHAFVREVRAAGYRTAVITNSVLEWVPWWERVLPGKEYFDQIVHSCRVGLRKPGPAIFRYTLARLGVEPQEALFLDDFGAMVDGARAIGMVAVHVHDHDEALAEARAHLGSP